MAGNSPVYGPGWEFPHVVAQGVAVKPGCISPWQDGILLPIPARGAAEMTLYGYARVSVREPEDKNLDLQHETVRHGRKEYVRVYTCHGDGECPGDEPCVPEKVSTNGIESIWAVLCRSYYGTYHWMSPKHLHRYCDELSGRLNNRLHDTIDRLTVLFRAMEGKRLRYRDLIAG